EAGRQTRVEGDDATRLTGQPDDVDRRHSRQGLRDPVCSRRHDDTMAAARARLAESPKKGRGVVGPTVAGSANLAHIDAVVRRMNRIRVRESDRYTGTGQGGRQGTETTENDPSTA